MSEYCKNCFELAEKLTKKERECNTSKSQLDFAVQQKECFEQLCEALKSEGFTRESLITEQENEIDELRQECEELKRQHQADKGLITSTGKMNYQLIQEYDKLKTVLAEIKELAEKYNNTHLGEQQYCCKDILQKISECEVNND